jgi:ABC-2 type transport system permease protein
MIQSNATSEGPFDGESVAPAALSPTRPLYWSVRRELWENRSIYVAPLAVSAVAGFGTLISMATLPHRMRTIVSLDPAAQSVAVHKPFGFVAAVLIVTAFLVGVFYCLDALHGERRDRSILFWKSLPVSDLTAVLSKAIVPLAILPVITLVVIFVLQGVMLTLSTLVLLHHGRSLATFWASLPLFRMAVGLPYALTALALWHAPIYGWLLLVSAWARRTPFLWALLPPLALFVVEKIAFNTTHFAHFLGYRLTGLSAAFDLERHVGEGSDGLEQLTPARFLSTPGLWLGLVAAAVFLVAAARMRRYRGPI